MSPELVYGNCPYVSHIGEVRLKTLVFWILHPVQTYSQLRK